MRRDAGVERVRIRNPPRFIPWIYELVIIIAIAVSLVAAVVFGPADITWSTTTQVISYHLLRAELDEPMPAGSDTIVWDLHASWGILAAIIEAGLAVSDVTMQTLVHGPLADPYLLGISVDVGAGTAAVIIFGAFSRSPIAPLTFDTLLGAVMTTLAVGAFATAGGELIPLHLVLSSVVLFVAFSALSNSMIFAGPDPRVAQSVIFWMLGSVAGAIWVKALFPLIVLIVVLLLFLVKARQLDVLTTGESTAAAVGIDVTRLRTQVFVLQAVLASTPVTVSDGIRFVGLVIPHLTRILVGTTHRVVLPVVALMGGLFLVWVDIIARVVGGSQEMPLGMVTGLVEAPPFLYLMSHSHYSCGGVE